MHAPSKSIVSHTFNISTNSTALCEILAIEITCSKSISQYQQYRKGVIGGEMAGGLQHHKNFYTTESQLDSPHKAFYAIAG